MTDGFLYHVFFNTFPNRCISLYVQLELLCNHVCLTVWHFILVTVHHINGIFDFDIVTFKDMADMISILLWIFLQDNTARNLSFLRHMCCQLSVGGHGHVPHTCGCCSAGRLFDFIVVWLFCTFIYYISAFGKYKHEYLSIKTCLMLLQ